MSPTLYNRAEDSRYQQDSHRLRQIIKQYSLHSQELDFVPSIKDIAKQYVKNTFKCIPRNSDLFISASGDYLYCYNNISHLHAIGHINDLSIDDVLAKREKMCLRPELCNDCNMKERYQFKEVAGIVGRMAKDWFEPIKTG